MNSALWIILGWLCWSALVALVAWKGGFRVGVRCWETKAERAHRLGMLDGRRDERLEGGRQ